MMTTHLFDNPEHQATKAPPTKPAERVRKCCKAARAFTRLDRTIHQLAHSDVPFTEAWLMEECDTGPQLTRAACEQAVEKNQLHIVETATKDRGRMYRGRL